jgi:hypothetical protein
VFTNVEFQTIPGALLAPRVMKLHVTEFLTLYSDERLGEFLEIRHGHELTGARDELVARDLIAFKDGVYQVLDLPDQSQGY